MFVLVEPFKNILEDKPDLGCASLIASLNRNHIPNRLILSQTRFFHDFLRDPSEIIDLIFNLAKKEQQNLRFASLVDTINGDGEKSFRDNLKTYHKYIINKNLNFFLNPLNVLKINALLENYFSINHYFLTKQKNESIPLVKDTLNLIKSHKPDSIGFSIWTTDPFTNIIRKKIKQELDIPIIGGGALVPHLRKKNLKKFMLEQSFDYLVKGEGDLALPQLLSKIPGNEEKVPNLVYFKNNKLYSSKIKSIPNLNELPMPDFKQFNLKKYFNPFVELPIQLSRGCAWRKCTFCNHSLVYGSNYRCLKINMTIQMLSSLSKRYKTKHFSFHDEYIPAKILEKLCQNLIERNLTNFRFKGYVRFEEEFLKKNSFKMMYKAGFRNLYWGLESGSQRVLNLMNKGTNIVAVEKILKRSAEAKIKNSCFIIFGFPGETFNDFKKTINFLEKNRKNIHLIMTSAFMLSGNSTIGLNPSKWNLKIIEKDEFTDNLTFKYRKTPLQIRKINEASFLLNFGICDLSSNFYKCMMLKTISRTLMFALSTLNIKPKKEVYKLLDSNEFDALYPIVLGAIIKQDKKQFLQMADFTKSSYLNSKMNSKMPINDLEVYIFNKIVNMNMNNKELISAIMGDRDLSLKSSRQAVVNFYKKLLKNNAILFYTNTS